MNIILLLFLMFFSVNVFSYTCNDGTTGVDGGIEIDTSSCRDDCSSAFDDAKERLSRLPQEIQDKCEIKKRSLNNCLYAVDIYLYNRSHFNFPCTFHGEQKCTPDNTGIDHYVEIGESCCRDDCIGASCDEHDPNTGVCNDPNKQRKYVRYADTSQCSPTASVVGCYNNPDWPCCRKTGTSYQIPITDYAWTPTDECITKCSGTACPDGSRSAPDNSNDCPPGSVGIEVYNSETISYKCVYGDADDDYDGLGGDLPDESGQTGDSIGDTCDKPGTTKYGDGINDCDSSEPSEPDPDSAGDQPIDGKCGSISCEGTQQSILQTNEGIGKGVTDLNDGVNEVDESIKKIGIDIVESNNGIKDLLVESNNGIKDLLVESNNGMKDLADSLAIPPNNTTEEYSNPNIFIGNLDIKAEFSNRFNLIISSFSPDLGNVSTGSCNDLFSGSIVLLNRSFDYSFEKYCLYLQILSSVIYVLFGISVFLWVFGGKS